MKKLLYCALVLIVAQSGCAPACEHNLFPDSIGPFLFKEGSTWIYRNANHGNKDSFFLAKSNSEIVHGLTPAKCKGDRTDEFYSMTIVGPNDTFQVNIRKSYMNVSNNSFSINGSIFDSSISTGQCSNLDKRLCLISVTSLTIGANTFNEVYKITTSMLDRNGAELYVCDMYWVKNIGIVKIIRHDSASTTLDLVSWNVVQ